MTKHRVIFAGLLAACCQLGVAQAQDKDVLYVQSLAATCASCNGTQGRAIPGASVPGLAGQAAPQFIAKMKAYQSGALPATIMHQLSKGYSDAQIEQLAAYFAAQPVAR